MMWVVYAFLAFLGYGLVNFLFKVCGFRGFDGKVLLSVLYFVAMIVFGFLMIDEGVVFSGVFYGLFAGILSVLGSYSVYRAVQVSGSVVSFSVSNLSFVIPFFVGVLVLGESVGVIKGIGFLMVLLVVLMVGRISFSEKRDGFVDGGRSGFMYIMGGFMFLGFMDVVLKYSMMRVDSVYSVLFGLYLMGGLFYVRRLFEKVMEGEWKKYVVYGVLMGLFSGFGSFFYLKALSFGELSMVSVFVKMNIVIPVFGSVLFFKEKIDFERVVLLLLSVCAVVLLIGGG